MAANRFNQLLTLVWKNWLFSVSPLRTAVLDGVSQGSIADRPTPQLRNPVSYGAPNAAKSDHRSSIIRYSMSTIDHRCRPSVIDYPIIDVDHRSSMSTIDHRCRPSIIDVDHRSSVSIINSQWSNLSPCSQTTSGHRFSKWRAEMVWERD